MQEFLIACLPFVIIGICVAIICVNFKKTANKDNHLTEGMCLGMCFGVSVSTIFDINMGLTISLGLLIGQTIGMLIKK